MKARWGGVVFVGSCAHDTHIPTENESETGWGMGGMGAENET